MSQIDRHIIHRQSMVVSFARIMSYNGLQDRLADVVNQRILPGLNSVFDELSGQSSGTLTIPQLAIDCGTLYGPDWETELVERVCRQVREELQRYRPVTDEREEIRQLCDDWQFWLRTGRHRWDNRRPIAAEDLLRFKLDRAFLGQLTALLTPGGHAMQRLFRYSPAVFLDRLSDAYLRLVAPKGGRDLLALFEKVDFPARVRAVSIIRACCQVHGSNQDIPEQRSGSVGQSLATSFAMALAEVLWPELNRRQQKQLVQRVEEEIRARQIGEPSSVDQALLEGVLAKLTAAGAKRRAFGSTGATETAGSEATASAIRKPSLSGPQNMADHMTTGKRPVNPEDPISGSATARSDELEHYYIQNAGLVLVYPFISMLLQHVGYMDDEQHFLLEGQSNGTLLLQQLIGDEPPTDEHELPLNKVLMGLDPMAFVDCGRFECSPGIKQECELVLQSVIEHWTVLRNTSIAGLRETFLQRDGKLTARADGWLLQVEQRGVDVLLTGLPWAIGIVRLPWMRKLLYVEWAR